MKQSIFGLLLLLLTGLTSCYTNFSKNLDRDVTVRITTDLTTDITNEGDTSLTSTFTDDQFINAFMEGLKSEFSTSRIILVDEHAEFDIELGTLSIKEWTTKEKVNDAEAENNGEVFVLTHMDYSTSGTVVDTINNNRFSWNASKDKSEKITTNRSAGQVLTGENKDKTVYREKTLDGTDVTNLSNTCGSRAGVVIVKEIYKALNQ